MRRLILGCVALCGCVKDNPAWDAPTTGDPADAGTVSDSGSVGATTLADPTTGALPTTGPDAAETTDASTSLPEVAATDSTGDTSTGDPSTGAASTGDTSTSEPLAANCEASSWLRLEIADAELRDAGVVPTSMGAPCPWQPAQQDCATLNFGETGFFRLVNDPQRGKSVALLRFPREQVAARIAAAGKGIGDLIALKVELVVWEQKPQPDGPFTLELGLLDPGDWDWDEGDHDAQPLDDDDSSWHCKDFEKGDCQQWAAGDALAGSSVLGDLKVLPAEAADHDIDMFGDQYHAQLVSDVLAPALVDAYRDGGEPGLTVTIASPRNLDTGDLGIKLRESDWDAPALWAELCDQWK